jgi:uncharacterized membrane protein YgdD (TMEM256/DUF423 family)
MQRFFSAVGAIFCMLGLMMAAYSSHGLPDELAKHRMTLAAAFLFIHGLALLVLNAANLRKQIPNFIHALMLLGAVLFCGSLALSALYEFRAVAAPAGGIMLMLSWLCIAMHLGRK